MLNNEKGEIEQGNKPSKNNFLDKSIKFVNYLDENQSKLNSVRNFLTDKQKEKEVYNEKNKENKDNIKSKLSKNDFIGKSIKFVNYLDKNKSKLNYARNFIKDKQKEEEVNLIVELYLGILACALGWGFWVILFLIWFVSWVFDIPEDLVTIIVLVPLYAPIFIFFIIAYLQGHFKK